MLTETQEPAASSHSTHRHSPGTHPHALLQDKGSSNSDIRAKISSPTETERCIESLIAVFQKYAGKDGYNYTLSKTEFLSFMNTELAAFTKNQKDPGVLDRMMKKLDTNSDGQLDFSEFLNLIGGLAMACHDSFLKAVPSQKRT
nr:protein S100-A11 isoform X1 [Pongo abelii]XP_054383863.1 protein S100-A11 isoform X1 [Pongo abelii]